MTTKQVSIAELQFATYNPRSISKHDFESLKRSIKEFGFVEPVVVNKDHTIIGGHQRVRAAQDLGQTKVPVVEVDLSKDKEKLLNLALNRIMGGWDEAKLAEIIYELRENPLLGASGLRQTEVDQLLDSVMSVNEDGFDADKAYGDIKEATIQVGDIYQLGDHRIICGDATNAETVSALMGEEKAQLVFTDPPYNVDYASPGRKTIGDGRDWSNSYAEGKYKHDKIFNDNLPTDQYQSLLKGFLEVAHRISLPSANAYIWHGMLFHSLVEECLVLAGWQPKHTVIWVKNSTVLGRGDYMHGYEPCLHAWKQGEGHKTNQKYHISDVTALDIESFDQLIDIWYVKRDSVTSYVHPTQKPVRLAEKAIKKHTQQGDVVYDCFGGSGSTLLACEQLKRKARLVELDPKYIQVIISRWEQYTGEKAKKL